MIRRDEILYVLHEFGAAKEIKTKQSVIRRNEKSPAGAAALACRCISTSTTHRREPSRERVTELPEFDIACMKIRKRV